MDNALKNNATASIKAIVYQFYVALEKCFDLLEGEKVFIEKYGDVTVSGSTQTEVKDYSDTLTDLHENIWKTLNNWLQDDFDVHHYKYLVLLTTQNFASKSSFKKWNEKNKDEKLQILNSIFEKYLKKKKKSEVTQKLLHSVLDKDKSDKLSEILTKFIILDESPSDVDYYQQLVQRHGNVVLSANREDYINALLGYIVSPLIKDNISWEINYENFSAKKQALASEYNSKTIIFPKKYSIAPASENDLQFHANHLFVRKIEDIEYSDVKTEAIADFMNFRQIISDELSKYSIGKNHYEGYENEIFRVYSTRFRKASRSTNTIEQIKHSQDFFDDLTGEQSPNFIHFNDTPRYFRNGLLHEMADDESKEVIWKLKVPGNE